MKIDTKIASELLVERDVGKIPHIWSCKEEKDISCGFEIVVPTRTVSVTLNERERWYTKTYTIIKHVESMRYYKMLAFIPATELQGDIYDTFEHIDCVELIEVLPIEVYRVAYDED